MTAPGTAARIAASARLDRGFGTVAEDAAPNSVVPQTDATRDAGVIGGNPDVVRQGDLDSGGVASTQIKNVIVHERVDLTDDLEHALVPLPAAELLARGV